jgi:FMN phosphatase YigB (HAD superfamily)
VGGHWTVATADPEGYANAVVSAAVLFDLDGTLIDHRAAAVGIQASLEYSGSVDSVELPNLELRWLSFDDRTWMSFSSASTRSLSNGVADYVSSYQRWVSPLVATVNLTRGWAGRSARHQQ